MQKKKLVWRTCLGWWVVSKGCQPKDDDSDFDENNEVTILKSSFIDLKK